MATAEQIEAKLTELIQSKADLDIFAQKWGRGVTIPDEVNADELIPKLINKIVTDAMANDVLDELGYALGFPTDKHATYKREIWSDRRSWIALILSALAFLISVIALWKS